MSSSKRSRGEQEAEKPAGTQPSRLLDELEQLLALDPQLLARAAKDGTADGVLAELSNFSDNLRASIQTVQKELQEEAVAAAQVRAAENEAAEEKKRRAGFQHVL